MRSRFEPGTLSDAPSSKPHLCLSGTGLNRATLKTWAFILFFKAIYPNSPFLMSNFSLFQLLKLTLVSIISLLSTVKDISSTFKTENWWNKVWGNVFTETFSHVLSKVRSIGDVCYLVLVISLISTQSRVYVDKHFSLVAEVTAEKRSFLPLFFPLNLESVKKKSCKSTCWVWV